MGHDCVVYTDHKPLVHLKSFRDLVPVNGRFRWIQYAKRAKILFSLSIMQICGVLAAVVVVVA